MILNKIISLMKQAESIAILPHISADGDALGSSIALGLALVKLKKNVTIYLEESIPRNYAFLPGRELVEVIEYKESGASGLDTFSAIQKADRRHPDLVIALDTGDLGRLGKRIDIFNITDNTVNIDHHQTNTEFARHNYVHTLSSAVGEIIYQLVKMAELSLDPDISVCLYVAIATDTGGFRYSNTTAVTHQIAADLINNGVDVAEISQKVFDTTPLSKVRLMGEAINGIELLEGGKIAFIVISDEMLSRSGAREEDSEGIVNLGRNIEGVEVAILLRQRGDSLIKANLRSKSYVDVSAIANTFKGGGHKRASGFTSEGRLDEVKERLLLKIKEVL